MKSICLTSSLLAALLAGAGLGACGGSEKPVAAPTPAKMTWGAEARERAEDETDAASERDTAAPAAPAPAKPAEPAPEESSTEDDGAIDLDAMAANKAAAAAEEPEQEPEPGAEPRTAAPAADPVAAELQRRRDQKARRAGRGKKSSPKKRAAAATADSDSDSDSDAEKPAYKGSDPCRAESFSVPRVREACSSGGRPAAKRIMKDAIGKATATGQLLKCVDCHSNQRDYALKSNAVRDLKRWLES